MDLHCQRVRNTSSTYPPRRSTLFPTSGRPSVNHLFFSDTPEGSHSAWFQAECLSKKFTPPVPHSESSPALHRASPKTDANTAMHFRIPKE
ncbi:hypothetical protein AVEN_197181-1 [Araneus ventricosus]|uniref:Uncharacterized protein n=1 Tax=Araneus ventricosus TaxID=182803 RepID=A0A4Y2V4W0_ARAVE|nr:hypothetical protein AVEN_197181-1 [Araneus ventricosus]